MNKITVGNAPDETPARKGWFVGHFIDEDALRQSEALEVKWGVHPAGERNAGGFVVNHRATTLSLILSGHFRLWFRETDPPQPVDLRAHGEYVVWAPGVPHDWEAVTDCVVLTIRWPSLPQDQTKAAQGPETREQ